MIVSVLMMCAGSLVIAVLPTYATIGAAAPALLLVARCFQGLSVGGEYGTSATYMSEIAVAGRRGFFASFQYVTVIAGQVAALVVVLVLQMLLTHEELRAWGCLALGLLLLCLVALTFWISSSACLTRPNRSCTAR